MLRGCSHRHCGSSLFANSLTQIGSDGRACAIDLFYLTWNDREHGITTPSSYARFVCAHLPVPQRMARLPHLPWGLEAARFRAVSPAELGTSLGHGNRCARRGPG